MRHHGEITVQQHRSMPCPVAAAGHVEGRSRALAQPSVEPRWTASSMGFLHLDALRAAVASPRVIAEQAGSGPVAMVAKDDGSVEHFGRQDASIVRATLTEVAHWHDRVGDSDDVWRCPRSPGRRDERPGPSGRYRAARTEGQACRPPHAAHVEIGRRSTDLAASMAADHSEGLARRWRIGGGWATPSSLRRSARPSCLAAPPLDERTRRRARSLLANSAVDSSRRLPRASKSGRERSREEPSPSTPTGPVEGESARFPMRRRRRGKTISARASGVRGLCSEVPGARATHEHEPVGRARRADRWPPGRARGRLISAVSTPPWRKVMHMGAAPPAHVRWRRSTVASANPDQTSTSKPPWRARQLCSPGRYARVAPRIPSRAPDRAFRRVSGAPQPHDRSIARCGLGGEPTLYRNAAQMPDPPSTWTSRASAAARASTSRRMKVCLPARQGAGQISDHRCGQGRVVRRRSALLLRSRPSGAFWPGRSSKPDRFPPCGGSSRCAPNAPSPPTTPPPGRVRVATNLGPAFEHHHAT